MVNKSSPIGGFDGANPSSPTINEKRNIYIWERF